MERIRSDAGISLTETIVALALFASAALPIAGISVQLGAIVTSVHTRSQSLAVAEHRIERILRQPYDVLADGAADERGVAMEWTVTEGLLSKQVVLTYRYNLRDAVRQDTVTAARPRP